jgi:hypothetical protein
MFGHRYFGAREYGPSYFGPGVSTPTPPPSGIGGGGGSYGRASYTKKRFGQVVDDWFRVYKELRATPAKIEAAAIVAPFVAEKKVDWQAFAKDAEATHKLIALWAEHMAILEDDDEVVMLDS